jgi:hypothetical protein
MDALQREHLAEIAVEALSGGTNARRRLWLIPTILGLSAAAVLAALVTVISNGHSRKDTLQLKAEIARLNGGLLQQGELLRRSRAGACFPDCKRRVGHSGVFESANRRDPQKKWLPTAVQKANL